MEFFRRNRLGMQVAENDLIPAIVGDCPYCNGGRCVAAGTFKILVLSDNLVAQTAVGQFLHSLASIERLRHAHFDTRGVVQQPNLFNR